MSVYFNANHFELCTCLFILTPLFSCPFACPHRPSLLASSPWALPVSTFWATFFFFHSVALFFPHQTFRLVGPYLLFSSRSCSSLLFSLTAPPPSPLCHCLISSMQRIPAIRFTFYLAAVHSATVTLSVPTGLTPATLMKLWKLAFVSLYLRVCGYLLKIVRTEQLRLIMLTYIPGSEC